MGNQHELAKHLNPNYFRQQFVGCHDDSPPESFTPQEGHWIKIGELYEVIGAVQALNADGETYSLALSKNGVPLNPYGDKKRSFGISSKRFGDPINIYLN